MLKKGDLVLCETCDTPIYKLTRDADFGDDVDETLLRALLPQNKAKNGEVCFCKHCGNGVEFTKFKTRNGKVIDLESKVVDLL